MALPERPEPTTKAIEMEARFGAAFLRRHWLRLLLLFIGVLLPLWGFAGLVEELREGEPFFFDEPILRFAHDMARAGFDRVFLLFSALGYQWGVVPADVAMVAGLAVRRRAREGLFAGLALGGSALLNLVTKQLFARDRPSFWESIAPETTYSFPSGHAMGSMTLAWVCVLLAWRDSPGPFTTQPITARVRFSAPGWVIFHSGIFARTCSCTRLASSWKKVLVVRPQPGHAVTSGVNARRPIVCSSSCATTTSCVRGAPGSGVSEMRIVSPMPSCSSTPSAAVEATMPLDPMPASVRPRCSA